MEMTSQMEKLSKLSQTGTRLWIINELGFVDQLDWSRYSQAKETSVPNLLGVQ